MPIPVAFVISLALHVGVLLFPGWSLPLGHEPEAAPLDAVLAPPAQPAVRPAPTAPQQQKTPPPKPLKPFKPPEPATPSTPVAQVTGESVPQQSPPADPEPTVADEPEPEQTSPPAPEPAGASAPGPVAVDAQPAVPLGPTFAREWPRQGRIVFEVTRGEGGLIIGRSEHSWHHDGSSYSLRAVTETTGLAALFHPAEVVQESRGGFDAAGFRPLEFDSWRDGRPKDSIRFEPEQGRIRFASGRDAPFVPAVQDMLSLFYQLGAVSEKEWQAGIAVASGRKVEVFAVAVGEVEEIETVLGLRQAWHLRIAGTAAQDSTEVWLDARSRLPLRIRHRDRKGEVYDQIMKTLELDLPQ